MDGRRRLFPQAKRREPVAASRSPVKPAAPRARAAGAAKRLRPPRLLTYVDAVARYGSIRRRPTPSTWRRRRSTARSSTSKRTSARRCSNGCRAASAHRGRRGFLVYARQVISELQGRRIGVEQFRGLVRGRVSVAAVESVAGELLPSAITRFQSTHPYVRFHVRIGAPEELVAALVADQVDLIFDASPGAAQEGRAVVAAARQALCAWWP